MQLAAYHYMSFKDYQISDKEKSEMHRNKALAVINKMQDNIPERTIRYDAKDLHYQLGRLYGELGDKEELKRIMDILMVRKDLSIRDKVDYGQVYLSQLDSFQIGKTIFEGLYEEFKSIENGQRLISQNEMKEWRNYFTQIVSSLIFTYKKLDMINEAELVINDWLNKNPNDPVAKQLLEDLKSE